MRGRIHRNPAFQYRYRSAGRLAKHIELGTHRPHHRIATAHGEGTVLVFCDLEKRLAINKFDATLLLREFDAQPRASVQIYGRAIGERNGKSLSHVGGITWKTLSLPPDGARDNEDHRAKSGSEKSAARMRGSPCPRRLRRQMIELRGHGMWLVRFRASVIERDDIFTRVCVRDERVHIDLASELDRGQ